ncbi:hypothetical protein ADE_39660 [Achromobacter denitrificans]|nr:hypothetical protein ADE_39660 [Achromobacter denitrificans]
MAPQAVVAASDMAAPIERENRGLGGLAWCAIRFVSVMTSGQQAGTLKPDPGATGG